MAWVAPKSWVSSDTIADPAAELNRIEGNTKYLYDLLAVFALIAAQTHKLDWVMTDYPTAAQSQNIDDNLRAMAEMYGLPFTARDWTGVVVADYRVWNEWESLLAAVKIIVDYLPGQFIYCGTLYAGEDGGIY